MAKVTGSWNKNRLLADHQVFPSGFLSLSTEYKGIKFYILLPLHNTSLETVCCVLYHGSVNKSETLFHYFFYVTIYEKNWNLHYVSKPNLTVCYCHVTHEFQSESTLYSLPEYQGAPCLKQAQYLKFKWQRRDSNPQPLSS